MGKVLAQTQAPPSLPGGSVHLASLHAGPDCLSGRSLRFQNGIIEPPDLNRRASQKYCPGQVAAITAEYSTLVQDDQFVFPEELGSRPRVRPGRPRPGSDDSVEARATPTPLLDFVFDLC